MVDNPGLGSTTLMAFVATTNASRARAFFEGVLGLSLVSDEEFALVFNANGTMLRIQKVEALTPHPFTSLGWQVDDIAATIRDLVAKGVVFERYGFMQQDDLGVWSHDGARIAWFKDPDGNTLSLAQF
jgi:catechol 2,3-dioxygenase-like lactoylglutathione lyase family enzyme